LPHKIVVQEACKAGMNSKGPLLSRSAVLNKLHLIDTEEVRSLFASNSKLLARVLKVSLPKIFLKSFPFEECILTFFVSVNKYLWQVPLALLSMMDLKRPWITDKHHSKTTDTTNHIYHYMLHECSPEVVVMDDICDHQERFERYDKQILLSGNCVDIRFFASVPLYVEGFRIGTVSVFDNVRRADIVDKCLKVLPGIGKVVSDMLSLLYHQLYDGLQPIAELKVAVMYNMKLPLAQVQSAFHILIKKYKEHRSAAVKEAIASKKKLNRSLKNNGENSNSHGFMASERSDQVEAAVVCSESENHILDLRYGVVAASNELRKKLLVLMRTVDTCLSIAHGMQRSQHALQVLKLQRLESHAGGRCAVSSSTSRTHHTPANQAKIPPRVPLPVALTAQTELLKEKALSNSTLNRQLNKLYHSLCSARPSHFSWDVSPVFLAGPDNEHKFYQVNMEVLKLVLYSIMYHTRRKQPSSDVHVQVMFEERPVSGGGAGGAGGHGVVAHGGLRGSVLSDIAAEAAKNRAKLSPLNSNNNFEAASNDTTTINNSNNINNSNSRNSATVNTDGNTSKLAHSPVSAQSSGQYNYLPGVSKSADLLLGVDASAVNTVSITSDGRSGDTFSMSPTDNPRRNSQTSVHSPPVVEVVNTTTSTTHKSADSSAVVVSHQQQHSQQAHHHHHHQHHGLRDFLGSSSGDSSVDDSSHINDAAVESNKAKGFPVVANIVIPKGTNQLPDSHDSGEVSPLGGLSGPPVAGSAKIAKPNNRVLRHSFTMSAISPVGGTNATKGNIVNGDMLVTFISYVGENERFQAHVPKESAAAAVSSASFAAATATAALAASSQATKVAKEAVEGPMVAHTSIRSSISSKYSSGFDSLPSEERANMFNAEEDALISYEVSPIQTPMFENTVLTNVLRIVGGGFSSSTGNSFNYESTKPTVSPKPSQTVYSASTKLGSSTANDLSAHIKEAQMRIQKMSEIPTYESFHGGSMQQSIDADRESSCGASDHGGGGGMGRRSMSVAGSSASACGDGPREVAYKIVVRVPCHLMGPSHIMSPLHSLASQRGLGSTAQSRAASAHTSPAHGNSNSNGNLAALVAAVKDVNGREVVTSAGDTLYHNNPSEYSTPGYTPPRTPPRRDLLAPDMGERSDRMLKKSAATIAPAPHCTSTSTHEEEDEEEEERELLVGFSVKVKPQPSRSRNVTPTSASAKQYAQQQLLQQQPQQQQQQQQPQQVKSYQSKVMNSSNVSGNDNDNSNGDDKHPQFKVEEKPVSVALIAVAVPVILLYMPMKFIFSLVFGRSQRTPKALARVATDVSNTSSGK
jgi:hypothetical protein